MYFFLRVLEFGNKKNLIRNQSFVYIQATGFLFFVNSNNKYLLLLFTKYFLLSISYPITRLIDGIIGRIFDY